MTGSPLTNRIILAAVVVAVLGVLRFRPWQGSAAAPGAHETLTVGYLPVT